MSTWTDAMDQPLWGYGPDGALMPPGDFLEAPERPEGTNAPVGAVVASETTGDPSVMVSRARAALAVLELFGFNPHQRRGPDGRWIKMGGAGSASGKPAARRTMPAGFDPAPMAALGWEPDDPQLIDIAHEAQRYGFTSFEPHAVGGSAAFFKYKPDVLGVGPKSRWTPEQFAKEKAQMGGEYYMANAGDDPVRYLVAHEAGHRAHHLGTGLERVDRQADALAKFAADKGLMRVDPFGYSPDRPFTAADFDTYGDPEAFKALRQHGLSWYGSTHITELIAELHAAYQLGSNNELVTLMAETEGWSR